MAKTENNVEQVIDALEAAYPGARQELNFSSPFELLIATILAAQCTDARVNEVTENLFQKYPDPAAFVAIDPEELQEDIRKITFYRNKTKGIQSACRMLLDEFGGEVPEDVDSLVRLPYVGRKTANIVRANAMGIAAIGVDTHTIRVPNRLGWVTGKDPDKIEKTLCELIPQERWHRANLLIQWHGRYTCKAKKPKCTECPVYHLCSWEDKV